MAVYSEENIAQNSRDEAAGSGGKEEKAGGEGAPFLAQFFNMFVVNKPEKNKIGPCFYRVLLFTNNSS